MPIHIRALLFTDHVDSTALASTLGDAASSLLSSAHDRAARDLLATWRGQEIDRTDGLFLLFRMPSDAVGYAIDYHAAMARLDPPLRARVGIHVGPVIERATDAADVARGAKPIEIDGIAKPIAARVTAIAGAGQTLVTGDARDALGPVPWRVRSHGHWRLKGIPDPIELFEIGDERAPFEPPSDEDKAYRVVRDGELWLPARHVKRQLPAERDSFVDRREPVELLARRFDSGARLVSVVGMGGGGKTRFAVRFAWTWLGEFGGGAWFCDLAQARGVEGLVQAVGQGLAVALGTDDATGEIGHAIAGRGRCLVILDNFEQVARHAGETLGRWLDRAPEARFLVTTREVLGLAGEETLMLPPLQVSDGAVLFAQRASAAHRELATTAQDEAAIPQLVSLLDGLPLAIELAAARVRVMAPATLLARMDQRFKLLTATGARHDRHATLRATFDWSWELLPADEKSALAQLSVFEGGFTLRAAEGMLDLGEAADARWAVDVVQALVEKSFVRAGSKSRFTLLSSVQEYAAEHLRTPGRFEGSGPALVRATEARHGVFFASLTPADATAEGCVELDNLVSACRRAAARQDAAVAVGALELSWAALERHGPFATGIALAAAVAKVPDLGPLEIARVRIVAGWAEQASGHLARARPHLEAALSLALDGADDPLAAQAQGRLGDLCANDGQVDAARRHLDAALAGARRTGQPTLECQVLSTLGGLDFAAGQLEGARTRYEAALRSARVAGDRRWEGGVLGNLGSLHAALGRMADARRHFEGALAAAREAGDLKFQGNTLSNLGLLDQMEGHAAPARERLDAALALARDTGHRRLQSVVLCNLGILLDEQRDAEGARQRYEEALEIVRELGDRRTEGQVLGYVGLLHARQGRAAEARAALDSSESLLAQSADAGSLAIVLCASAEAAHRAGDASRAREVLDRACVLARSLEAGEASELGLALARASTLIGC